MVASILAGLGIQIVSLRADTTGRREYLSRAGQEDVPTSYRTGGRNQRAEAKGVPDRADVIRVLGVPEVPRGETPAALDMLSIEAIATPGRCDRTTAHWGDVSLRRSLVGNRSGGSRRAAVPTGPRDDTLRAGPRPRPTSRSLPARAGSGEREVLAAILGLL